MKVSGQSRPDRFTHVLINHEAGQVPESAWMLWRREILLPPPGIEPQILRRPPALIPVATETELTQYVVFLPS
jgi:hypothetical protein